MSRPKIRRRPCVICHSLILLLLLVLSTNFTLNAREIEATHEWTLLGENDTIAAGMHVRMDLTTGEKWVKLPDEDDDDTSNQDSNAISSATVSTSGSVDVSTQQGEYDFVMMERVLEKLPSEEWDRMGGKPLELVGGSNGGNSRRQRTPAEQKIIEQKLAQIWEQRQAEINQWEDEFLADLPQILRDRIEGIQEYIHNPLPHLRQVTQQIQDKENGIESDGQSFSIVDALSDLEYQLSDIDMARDFHTLHGWPLLVSLLTDNVHTVISDTNNTSSDSAAAVDYTPAIDTIQAHAAWVVGTMVKNTGEFTPFVLEVLPVTESIHIGSYSTVYKTPVGILLSKFVDSIDKLDTKTGAFKSQKLLYGLSAALRGNPAAQDAVLSVDGYKMLHAQLQRLLQQPSQKRLVQRILSLMYDLICEVESVSDGDNSVLLKALTAEEWCSVSADVAGYGDTSSDSFSSIKREWMEALGGYCGHIPAYNDAKALLSEIM